MWLVIIFPHSKPLAYAGRAEVLIERMEVNWQSTMEKLKWQPGIALTRGVLNMSKSYPLKLQLIYNGENNEILAMNNNKRNPQTTILQTHNFSTSSYYLTQ
jgi:hypothetical protein